MRDRVRLAIDPDEDAFSELVLPVPRSKIREMGWEGRQRPFFRIRDTFNNDLSSCPLNPHTMYMEVYDGTTRERLFTYDSLDLTRSGRTHWVRFVTFLQITRNDMLEAGEPLSEIL